MVSRTSRNNKESKIFNAEITSYINLTESNYLVSDFRTEQFNDENWCTKCNSKLLNAQSRYNM